MSHRMIAAVLCFLAAVPLLPADEPTSTLLKDIQAVSKEGAGSPAARAAWDKLVARGPAVLPDILQAMDTPSTAAANWLRTAFDAIVDGELKEGRPAIDREILLAFVMDARRPGRGRRLALELLERLDARLPEEVYLRWVDDPEFRYDAVEHVIRRGDRMDRLGFDREAVAHYRHAFDVTRDVDQARMAVQRLTKHKVRMDIASHFGFLTDWYVIGPFDAASMKGFKTVYPPEEKIDLADELPGKDGKVRWKRYQVKVNPAAPAKSVALANLREPLGDAEDAVAYAYTKFTVPKSMAVEFRGAADDNFTVWVNGARVFAFEEYRNGVRLDRHRFRVRLHEGENMVLVKVCQAPIIPSNTEPNWEFLLRVVDDDGKGVAVKSALPAEK